MMPHASSDSDAKVQNALIDVSRALSNAQSERAEMLTKDLDAVSTARLTMSLLAQSIFYNSTSEEALIPMDLEVMAYLVTSNPDKYLKDASRAVRSAAELASVTTKSIDPYFTVEKSSKIAQVISSQIFSEDVEVSDNASKAMVAMCRKFDTVVDPSVEAIMHCWSLTSSPVVAIRCASTLIDIIVFNERAMNLAVSVGAMDKVVDLMTGGKDPLTQMVIIDLIETIATTKPIHVSCARWILTNQVLLPLLEMAGGTGEIDPLLGGPALRLLSLIFSNVVSKHLVSENLDSNHFQRFKRALHSFDSSGESGRLAFIDAVSSFASASENALTEVLDDPFLREKWLSLKNVAQPKLKSAVLGSVARVIDQDSVKGDNTRQAELASLSPSNALSLRLFKLFGSVNERDPSDMLILLARSPIVETRLGSYALLQAITKREMGVKTLLSNKDFFDFLIDRAVEHTKEGKEAKHIIVENVLKGQGHIMLSEEAVKKLQDVVDQGPFFVETLSWEMATE
jgi:hypothetical protein